ncbi:protein HP-25 homolog 1-like [Tamandua tetradactyla]|uniref:protein HP-25 homolog 1-like n=1 Tax=Tamandua tetradactyla TaxID=48850 RepID=UPI004053DD1D
MNTSFNPHVRMAEEERRCFSMGISGLWMLAMSLLMTRAVVEVSADSVTYETQGPPGPPGPHGPPRIRGPAGYQGGGSVHGLRIGLGSPTWKASTRPLKCLCTLIWHQFHMGCSVFLFGPPGFTGLPGISGQPEGFKGRHWDFTCRFPGNSHFHFDVELQDFKVKVSLLRNQIQVLEKHQVSRKEYDHISGAVFMSLKKGEKV